MGTSKYDMTSKDEKQNTGEQGQNKPPAMGGLRKTLGLVTWNVHRSYGEAQRNEVLMLTDFLKKIKLILA